MADPRTAARAADAGGGGAGAAQAGAAAQSDPGSQASSAGGPPAAAGASWLDGAGDSAVVRALLCRMQTRQCETETGRLAAASHCNRAVPDARAQLDVSK